MRTWAVVILSPKTPENTEGDTSGQNRKSVSKAKPFRRVQQSRKSTLRPSGKLRPILSTAYALHWKNVLIHNWITDIKRLLHLTGFHIQPWGGESKFGCIGPAQCRLNLVASALNPRHWGLSPAKVADSGAAGFSVQLMIPCCVILSQVLKQSAAWSSDCVWPCECETSVSARVPRHSG